MWYDFAGQAAVWIAGIIAVAGVCALTIRYERGRRRLEARRTPEERRFRDVLSTASGGGWGLPRR